jgi:ribonuclease P protein component
VIPQTHRFHGINALSNVYKRGRGARDGGLTIRTLPSKRDDYRLAVVVSKKVHKSAVVRNRIRRRLFECARMIKKADPGPWPHDIVITCFDEGIATQPAGQLRANVEKLLQKAKITTKNSSHQ